MTKRLERLILKLKGIRNKKLTLIYSRKIDVEIVNELPHGKAPG